VGKNYTVLVFSQQACRIRKFFLSHLTLKIGAGLVALLVGISGYLSYDYFTHQKNLVDLRNLRTEIYSQQAEIQSFLEKISLLEEELARLRKIEEQVRKDLGEVQQLKKEKNIKKLSRPILPQKGPEPSEAIKPSQGATFFRQDRVSILEKERPRLVSRLHHELLELSKETFQRAQSLKELEDFLRAQKSVLLAIPSLWPVLGRITSAFGDTRISLSSGGVRPHMGVDIAAPLGSPIVAPADGVVISAGREAEYGRLVCLDHGHGYSTVFGHMKDIYVTVGRKVKEGEVIGTVGASGSTTGPHLHYEVRIHGRPVNPFQYLNRKS